MTVATLDQRIDTVARELQTLISESSKDEAARKKLLSVTSKASAQAESPVETLWKIIVSPHAPAALNVIVHSGVLAALVKAGRPQTADQLGASCKIDPWLIVRLMRPLTPLGLFRETGVQTYDLTDVSRKLAEEPSLAGAVQIMLTLPGKALAMLPEYFDDHGYKDVTNVPGPFEYSHDGESFFGYVHKRPKVMDKFNAFMTGGLQGNKSWFEFFPVDKILTDGASKDPNAVLLVDVGGGRGHDVQAFHRAYPNAPGKLVVEDLSVVIDDISQLDSAVSRRKHDFFTEQPIKGARGYYFRHIFHDWPDKECIVIASHIAKAMRRGYSKLLIFEWVLPEKDVPLYPAQLDLNMLAVLSGTERTQKQWEKVLDAAGLKISKVWKADENTQALIEAELK